MKKDETIIQEAIMDYLRYKDIPTWRMSGASNLSGFPDLLVCFRGYFVALEVKTPTGKPTRQQMITIQRINDEGGCACLVTSVDEVDKLLWYIEDKMDTGNELNLGYLSKDARWLL